jgi:enoyl-CoA hydratase/carnithine racemase
MPIEYSLREDIAIITLSDPDRRNALSRASIRGLHEAMARSRDDRARGVVIAAKGPAFCAGANIDDLRTGWMENRVPETDPTRFFKSLTDDPRVVVAAVHGIALGGGFELTLACDMVVAGPEASFVCPELSLGVIPPTGLALLARSVGRRRALELMLTRRRVKVDEALSIGIVNKVAAADSVLEDAVDLARSVVGSVPPGALAVTKKYNNLLNPVDWELVFSSSKEVPAEEWREGLASFLEKRQPDYGQFWDKNKGQS